VQGASEHTNYKDALVTCCATRAIVGLQGTLPLGAKPLLRAISQVLSSRSLGHEATAVLTSLLHRLEHEGWLVKGQQAASAPTAPAHGRASAASVASSAARTVHHPAASPAAARAGERSRSATPEFVPPAADAEPAPASAAVAGRAASGHSTPAAARAPSALDQLFMRLASTQSHLHHNAAHAAHSASEQAAAVSPPSRSSVAGRASSTKPLRSAAGSSRVVDQVTQRVDYLCMLIESLLEKNGVSKAAGKAIAPAVPEAHTSSHEGQPSLQACKFEQSARKLGRAASSVATSTSVRTSHFLVAEHVQLAATDAHAVPDNIADERTLQHNLFELLELKIRTANLARLLLEPGVAAAAPTSARGPRAQHAPPPQWHAGKERPERSSVDEQRVMESYARAMKRVRDFRAREAAKREAAREAERARARARAAPRARSSARSRQTVCARVARMHVVWAALVCLHIGTWFTCCMHGVRFQCH
jgi:hypothetical protein